jgi:hypothetical protein
LQCSATETKSEPGPHTTTTRTIKEATCAEEGLSETSCSCRYISYTSTIPKKDHSYGSWTTIPATCTENGYSYRTCTVCKNQEIEAGAEALGHNWKYVPYDDLEA